MKFITSVCSLVDNLKLSGILGSTDPTNVPVESTSIPNDNVIEMKEKRFKKSTKSLEVSLI